ncbi:hypothetical protein A4U64_09465 [Rhodococcus sp. WB1]|nr:hypothetical protein A4U64_09465 [Rhodococcus sp. WB1]PND48758.1 hypothetical protein CQZ88_28585 [Rhodococcus sp. ENV425]
MTAATGTVTSVEVAVDVGAAPSAELPHPARRVVRDRATPRERALGRANLGSTGTHPRVATAGGVAVALLEWGMMAG